MDMNKKNDKEKWEKNAKELRDLIAKMQKRIKQEKELGEYEDLDKDYKSFEGSLDDFEIWLKDWQPNIEEKYFNPKSYTIFKLQKNWKVIKMKELLNLKETKYE